MEFSNSDSESIAEVCNNSDEDDKKGDTRLNPGNQLASGNLEQVFFVHVLVFFCSTYVSINTERHQEKKESKRTEKHIGVFLKQKGSIEALAFKPHQLTATDLF